MTLGQKIKKARIAVNLTQKELADQLSVTFQTVSKWESDTNEPDLTTLRAIAKLLNVTLEYLVSEEEEEPHPKPEPQPINIIPIIPTPSPEPEQRQIGFCADCNASIMEGDHYHRVERVTPSGVKETVLVCEACFNAHEEEMERRANEIEEELNQKPEIKKGNLFSRIVSRDDRKPLIWAMVLGLIAMIAVLVVCIIYYQKIGLGWTIGAPLLAGYSLMATIYCIFTASFVSDVFTSVASWSVRFPGLIFTWSLEGIAWLIAMKLLFFVLGIFIGIATFFLAVGISAVLSAFAFIPLLIYNKKHYV